MTWLCSLCACLSVQLSPAVSGSAAQQLPRAGLQTAVHRAGRTRAEGAGAGVRAAMAQNGGAKGRAQQNTGCGVWSWCRACVFTRVPQLSQAVEMESEDDLIDQMLPASPDSCLPCAWR